MNDTLPESLVEILAATPGLRRSYLVGGCVRDWLLGRPGRDFDIEVFGIGYEELVRALSRWGRVDLVGRSFGVAKLTLADGRCFDFTIPRRDSKTAPGHKGFEVALQPEIDPPSAAARRDFTINALMWDPHRREMLDFFGGERDLRQKTLRHTSAAFPEDPLRVLRGLQFAARFELTAAPETIALARSIKAAHAELAKERIRTEWFKWASESVRPSLGLRFLAETEWLDHYSEIARLRGVPQDPEWHPEGDVFIHTCHCLDALVELPAWRDADAESRIVYALAVLTHDCGKAETTREEFKRGRNCLVAPGHETASVPLAQSFLERIDAPNAIRERVPPLVANHMAYFEQPTPRAVRRLAKRLEPENIEGLLLVMTADSFGRPPLPRVIPPSLASIRDQALALSVVHAAPAPLLLGRHLIERGWSPGPNFGAILESAYQAQLAGDFHDLSGALAWLDTLAPPPAAS